MKPVFALDVGGVLANKQHDGEPMPGSREGVATLIESFEVWVVSQCGRNRMLKTREWLADWKFPIPPEQQVYVPFSDTKVQPLRRLRARYFVDDRTKHVVPALLRVPTLFRVYHMTTDPKVADYAPADVRYIIVWSWAEMMRQVRVLT